MARFTDVWLSDLYAKSDIVDVISSYTALSPRGGRYWGLCPFHNEKTPSFSVNRDKQLYYCFGCKTGGNITNFVMKMENLSFGEAVEMLAQRAGMPVPQMLDDKRFREAKEKKQKIAQMHKIAARYYFDMLFAQKGKDALEYLKGRGIGEEIIRRFGLGFSSDSWDSVASLLADQGFSQSLINESGLVSVKDGKAFDTFRGRVMFPIINVFGDVIAFGGRTMGEAAPKYLNTKETLLFNKRRNLYGIDLLRKQRSAKSAVIVEGYMDVVSMAAHGVKAVVASLGTAFTKEQAVLLKRYVSDVFIAYDGDDAGELATQKAIDILEGQSFSVRVIRFDAGYDPDDFIRKYGIRGFAAKVKASPTSMGYKLQTAEKNFDLTTEDGKEAYAIEAAKILAGIESPITRERYTEEVAKKTGYSAASVIGQMQKKSKEQNTNTIYRYNSTEKSGSGGIEAAFLACAMANLLHFEKVADELCADDFALRTHKNIFSAIYDSVKRGIQPTYAELLSELESEEDISEASRLAGTDFFAQDPLAYLKDCINNILIRKKEIEREALIDALSNAHREQMCQLLAEIGQIDKELSQRKHKE